MIYKGTVNSCDGQATVNNNTYWSAPQNVKSNSTCSLAIELNPLAIVQRTLPVCQIRYFI